MKILLAISLTWASLVAAFWAVAPHIDWVGLAIAAWVSLSAIVNGFLDKRTPHTDSEWAAYYAAHPRVAALVKILRSIGLTPQTFISNVRTLFSGKPPAIILSIAAKLRAGDRVGLVEMRAQIEAEVRAKFAAERAELEERIKTLTAAVRQGGGS